MANDPFDALITTSMSPALALGAGTFANVQQRNDEIQSQRDARSQNFLQYMLEAGQRADENRQQERQFNLAYQQGEREAADRREQNSFARLTASLDSHLKMVELESQDRQRAFDNSLKLQQAGLQTKLQGLQLRQIEDTIRGEDAVAEIRALHTEMQLGQGGEDSWTYLNQMAEVARAAGAGIYKAQGGKELMDGLNGMIAARKQMGAVPKVSADFIPGEQFNLGEAQERVRNLNFNVSGGKLSDDDMQVLGYFTQEAARMRLDEGAIAEAAANLFSDKHPNDLTSTDRAMAQILAAANTPGADEGVKALAAKLADPVVQARFATLHESGALNPITSREQLEKLAAHDQSVMMQIGKLQEISGGLFMAAPTKELRDKRDDLLAEFAESRLDLLANGNPAAKSAMSGATEWKYAKEAVRKQIANSREGKSYSAADVFDAVTGIPSAWRDTKKIFGGRAGDLGWQDWLNLATFIPGLGYVGRGAMLVGKSARLASKAARLGRAADKAVDAFKAAKGAEKFGLGRISARALKDAKAATAASDAAWKATKGVYGASGWRTAAWGVPAASEAVRVPAAFMGAGSFRELSQAEDDVGEALTRIKGLQGRAGQSIIDELATKLGRYVEVAGSYFPDGQVPATIEQNMLNVRNMVPSYIWRRLQKNALLEGKFGSVGSGDTLSDLYQAFGQLAPYGGVPVARDLLAPMTTASGAVPGMNFDRPTE